MKVKKPPYLNISVYVFACNICMSIYLCVYMSVQIYVWCVLHGWCQRFILTVCFYYIHFLSNQLPSLTRQQVIGINLSLPDHYVIGAHHYAQLLEGARDQN